jgi:hypothetical protein
MRFLFLGLFLFNGLMINAQIFGGTPPSVKWKQINTDSFRIIFQTGLDSQAQRVASIVDYLATEKPVSLGDKLKKIDIVLQNQTTFPNGYVGLGPFRSEFFLTPVMNNFQEGSISWAEQLALHEYRHVQQFNNFRNGLSNLMYYLFGEEGLALAINAAIPDWFYEGDAVYNETILSRQGRGRLPLFNNAFPALWNAGKNYSWMKLRNGSLKNFVPNHYYLGYLLVNYGREKYGSDFWKNVTRDASAYKGLFYPFQQAIRKYAGVDYATFRKQAFDYYKRQFEPKKTNTIRKSNHVSNYYFPYKVAQDSLIYLKSTYRQRPAFYLKNGTSEKRLRARDISIDEQFGYRDGKIVYAAYETDPRWGWRDYSVLKLLDVRTGRQQKITSKTKYFTPDLSPSGEKIATAYYSAEGKSAIHILDLQGKLLSEVRSTDIVLYTDPKFIDEANLVTSVRLADGKMALALVDWQAGSTVRLTNPSFSVLGYPAVDNGYIYFTASYNGNDNIYAINIADRKIYLLTNSGTGDYFVNVRNGVITWSEFTAEGYQLRQQPVSTLNWLEQPLETKENAAAIFKVSLEDSVTDVLGAIPSSEYPVSDYRKSKGLFRIHSWRPYYSDPIFTYSIYTENILNTLQSEVYYLYNENERTSAGGFNLVYGGWFPYIQIGSEYTFSRQSLVNNRTKTWDQVDSRIGLTIPLYFTSGRSFRSFSAGSFYTLRNELNKGFFKDSLGNITFSYLQHFINWNQQVQRATQHIYPRWGWSTSLNHRHAIGGNNGYQFGGNGTIYLPGIASVHNLVLTGAVQKRDTVNIPPLFANRFSYSRGYIGRYFQKMWRASANYHLPLLYPDWGFANILYLQRVRVNLFYDFTRVYDQKSSADQRSVGGELFVETKWWNQYPLTFGVRVSHLLDRDQFDGWKGTIFEFVLPATILPR